MKRFLALLSLCICVGLMLLACGTTEEPAGNGDQSSQTSSSVGGGGGADEGNSGAGGSGENSGTENGGGETDGSTEGDGEGNGSTDGDGDGDGTGTEGGEGTHTHIFGEWVVVTDPSCSLEGTQKRECDCGEYETNPIPTTSHIEATVEGYAATCTETGLTDGLVCAECEKVLKEQEVIPFAHKPKTLEGYAPTCYEEGLTNGSVCEICEEILVPQTSIEIKHTAEIIPAVEPNCYEVGWTEGKKCADCGTILLPQQEIDVKHQPGVYEGYQPTDCFSEGYENGVSCTVCGEVIVERQVIPASHLDLVLVPGRIATCTESGMTDGYNCNACGQTVVAQEIIPLTLHNFVGGSCTHCDITEFSQGLAYSLSDDGEYYIVTGKGTCKDLKIIIPETYMGKTVKEIGSQAFMSDRSFISVVIPKTIEHVGSGAFSYTERLIEVYNLSPNVRVSSSEENGLWDSYYPKKIHTSLDEESVLKQVGDFIFAEVNTPKLMAYTGSSATVVLPEDYNGGKYEIFHYAFHDYKKLVSLTVPKNVVNVGLGAFYSCTSLVELYYFAGLQLEFNGSWQYGDLGRYALAIHGSLDEKSIVDYVGDFAFVTIDGESYLVNYVGDETKITLPREYKGGGYSIYTRALQSIKHLESVTIPGCVKEIGENALAYCTNLKEIIFEEGVTSIGKNAFEESGIRKITLPNSLTYLGEYAFYGCASLASVTFGDSLEEISGGTFVGCANMVSIRLPRSLKSIAAGAFGAESSNGLIRLKEIVNPSSLVLTMGSADNGCVAYQAIVIYTGENDKQSVIIEGDYAFLVIDGKYYLASYLGSDREITLPTSINGNTYEIAKNAFRSRKLIFTITIPNGPTAIGEYAFRDCTHLTTIYIAGSVKTIGDYAFRSCGYLVNVTLNEGLLEIGEYAFCYCIELESIVFPKSVKSIGRYLFRYTEKVKSVVFLDPDNWYITQTKGATSGTDQASRTDAEKNATSFTTGVPKYYWYKKTK